MPAMGDEETINLLREIRDLQKLQVENYKATLRNQQESIEIQKKAVRRQKVSLLVLLILVMLGVAFVLVEPMTRH